MMFLELFLEFFKIGLFAVGGGLATLPFLQELAQKKDWIRVEDISNMIAVSESTPGPLGINMASFTGYLQSGVPGAIIASLSLVLPSVIIIVIIARVLEQFRNSKTVQGIFYGLRPASAALIAVAGWGVAKITFFGTNYSDFLWKNALLAVAIWIVLKKTKWHPVIVIVASAVIGILFQF